MRFWTWLKSDEDIEIKAIFLIYGGGGGLAMIGMWAMFYFNCCG